MATNSIPAPVRRTLSYAVVSFVLLALLISGTGLITYALVEHLRYMPWMTSFVAGWALILVAFAAGVVVDERASD